MTTEEKLKEFILTKYRSLREFTQEIDMPYSTMTTILKKGVSNATVQNIIRICQALDISADELTEGRIVTVKQDNSETHKVEDIIYNTVQQLLNSSNLTIDDQPATKEDIFYIVSMLDASMEIRKKQMERISAYYNQLMKKDDQ